MPETNKRILFIEDDPFMVDMYSHVIEKHGYSVDVATDGKEGLKKAKTGEYDLVLLDIMMPEMLGIEVLENLRSDPDADMERTKVVVLTNLAQDDESRRAMEAQADGYLIKADITPSKLVDLIGQILGESGS
ncbi:MAG: response regulator [Candidatus Saccharimonadales bacterium]